jgi:hypothetical protein
MTDIDKPKIEDLPQEVALWTTFREVRRARGQDIDRLYAEWAAELERGLASPGPREDFAELCRAGCLSQGLAALIWLLEYSPSVRNRLDQAYLDKLDGKISKDFWTRKSGEWQSEEQRLCAEISSLEEMKPERILDGVRILELAHNAHFLYLKQTPQEQGKLLKMVVSNCSIDATSLYPTYRKPFDLIFTTGKNEGWRAQGFEPPTLCFEDILRFQLRNGANGETFLDQGP